MRNQLVFSLIVTLFTIFYSLADVFRPVTADSGMVVSADCYATEVGVQILKKGGNAVDAAVAVGFTLAVTYPSAGNIGGGGYMMIKMNDDSIRALDYREKAPLIADRDMYLDTTGNIIENASTVGYRSAGVPGTVAGLYKAHQKFGKLPWSDLVTPAIQLAQNGFVLDTYNAQRLNKTRDKLAQFESSRKIFTKNDSDFMAGDLLRQCDLAKTLTRIAGNGSAGFYEGMTAQLIEEDMVRNRGLITRKDLAAYEAKWRTPVSFDYRGFRIHAMPPSSSGGIVLAEILNTLSHFDIQKMGHNSSTLIHYWTEITRWAYADRSRWLGDSDFFNVPLEYLISPQHAKYILSKIDTRKTTLPEKIDTGYDWLKESGETTHFCVSDCNGNAVSNTYTINGWFGSMAVVKGAGFLLNNEMDDFSIKDGIVNSYGLTGGVANQIEPQKRMLSSMTPVIIEKNGDFFMAIGSPGGSTIITTVAQVILNVIDHGMNIRTAIEAPRFHHQWLPDSLYIESRLNTDAKNLLEEYGHHIVEKTHLGTAQGILWDDANQRYTGWSDPRANGITKGY